MAIVRAVKSGNWSDPTTWNTGALPTSADDVYCNTFTVAIDTSPTILSIRATSATGVTAGGRFNFTSGTTVTCTGAGFVGNNFNLAEINFGLSSPSFVNLVGIVQGSGGLVITGNGTVNLTGDIIGTSAGTCTATFQGSGANGATLNVTGTISGNTGGQATFRYQNIGGAVNVIGSVTNSATGGGCFSEYTSSNATLSITGTVTATDDKPVVNTTQTNGNFYFSGPFICSANGTQAIVAPKWRWTTANPTNTYYQIRNFANTAIRPIYTADFVGGNPAVTNVRSGTVYGPASELTGTCAVPAAASVAFGVPVGSTTGTATLTADNVRAAVGLASANLDTQLSTINTNVSALPSAATIASTIWQTLTSALTTAGSVGKLLVDNINATISSRLASASYTAPLNASDTRSAIGLASANLDTQLAPLPNLDTTVSSRLAASSYQTPLDAAGTRSAIGLASANLDSQLDALPTAVENAQAVRTELTPELNNLDAAVSTRSTFNPATDTVANVTLVDTTTNLTNPPDVPTTSEIATAVANELDPTLTTIDDNVLSRLAAVDYTEPPTAEQNAEAVRVELTPELDRVQNCATVATTGQQIQDALST